MCGVALAAGWWAWQSLAARVVLQEQDVQIRLPKELAVEAEVSRKIQVQVDQTVPLRVPIQHDPGHCAEADCADDGEHRHGGADRTTVPVKQVIEVDQVIELDTQVQTQVLGMAMTLPIRGSVPVKASVPIDRTFPLSTICRWRWCARRR